MKRLLTMLVSVVMLCCAAMPALAQGFVKDETVYILAAPDGTQRKIIVSDWLSNPDGEAELADVSGLTGIENVKGTQPFNGSVWQADGQDIYYQGESDQPLPIDLKITYTLDGQEITPNELAGKDGHVVIRFDYSVTKTSAMQVNGQEETISAPYAVITAALLENDVFSHVQAVNARIINDGDHTVLVGMALPGLQRSLDIDTETLAFPEYVEVEADVKAFALPVTVTLATNEVFAKLDAEQIADIDDLKQAMVDLTDGMTQLMDGGTQLCDGLADLATGTDLLADGMSALSDGLTTLIANNETLVAGSTQVFNTLLAAANQQLAAAEAGIPALTIENYAATLSALMDAMSEDGITQQAREQVEQAVRAQEEQVRAAVTQAVQSEVETQVTAAVQENVLVQVLASVNMTMENYAAAKESGQLPAEQQEQLEGAVKHQMASAEVKALIAQQIEAQMAADDTQAIIGQKAEEQVQLLIEQNMASDEIQQQIAQNVAQYQAISASLAALKEQLDNYNAFHNGLVAYTEGVATAASGATQLNENIPALQDGVTQLHDGALSMKEGLATFNTDGVEKLSELVNDDLDTLLARVRGLIDAARNEQNYAGIAENTEGAVRFIWRTDAIEP